MWKVKAGHEADFVAEWKALSEAFAKLANPPGQGTLIQSTTDPQLFYSFGPWARLEDVEAMRGDKRAREAIKRLVDLCAEAAPGTFTVVAKSPPGAT